MSATVIDIIRHGEPEGGKVYRGNSVDDPLSDKGWAQMWSALAGEMPWQAIVTSPLQRCTAFARALAEHSGLPLETDARLREVGFGEWEGRSRELVRTRYADQYRAFYENPLQNRPPGAEPLEAFVARVAEAIAEIARNGAGKHLLVVAHAGVIRAVMAFVLDLPLTSMYRLEIGYAGISRIRQDAGGYQVVFHNRCRL